MKHTYTNTSPTHWYTNHEHDDLRRRTLESRVLTCFAVSSSQVFTHNWKTPMKCIFFLLAEVVTLKAVWSSWCLVLVELGLELLHPRSWERNIRRSKWLCDDCQWQIFRPYVYDMSPSMFYEHDHSFTLLTMSKCIWTWLLLWFWAIWSQSSFPTIALILALTWDAVHVDRSFHIL